MKSIGIVSVSLPAKLIQKIDDCREDVSRSKFVQRLLEKGFEVSCDKTGEGKIESLT